MGRHSGPPTDPASAAPSRSRYPEPVTQEIEFTTVPWQQDEHEHAGVPTWTPASRPMPPITPASVQRQRTGPVPVTVVAPPDAASALPPEHRPLRAVGTPATDAIPVQLPQWEAPSLSTGPISVVPRPAPQVARRVRIGLGIAALAVAVSVVAQIVVLRAAASDAPGPRDGSGVAATSPLPTQTVGGGAFLTTRRP